MILVLSILFVYPLNTYALTEQTPYVDINNIESLEVGSLSFSSLVFQDYSKTSTQAFGITGTVTNNSSDNINYIATTYYYDSNYNLIASSYNSKMAILGTSYFNQMSNLSVLDGHSVDEIYYYRLFIDLSDYNSSSEYDLTPSKNNRYSSRDYVIDKYDVNIIVNENNTFDITETITAYFNVSKHGIYRKIPLINKVTRLDGTSSTNRAQVLNASVDNEYKISSENNYYKLQIGSPSYTLTGEQTYVIKYTYNLGKDPMKNYDELYYNIIGDEWDTVIGNITFSITMPKDFDASKLGFSSGNINSTENSKVIYNVSQNQIIGSYNGILGVGQSLTIRCELPEGYFVNAGLSISIMNYIMFLIPILFLGISIYLWYKYGRDDQVIETVEFYPPEGLNSLEVGFLYKGYAENKDVTSLLIYLASKGYIEINNKSIEINKEKTDLNQNTKNNEKIIELQNKINEERLNNPNSKKIRYYENMLDIYKNIDTPIDYKKYGLKSSINKLNKEDKVIIKKLKDYDGTNMHEKWFMEGLFEYDRTEVTYKMLYNKFYKTNNLILNNINQSQNKYKIFEESSSNKRILIILMIVATYCLITIPPLLAYNQTNSLFITSVSLCIVFPTLFLMVLCKLSKDLNIFCIIFLLIFGVMPWIYMILPIIRLDTLYFVSHIIGLICMLEMLICLVFLPKRTKYGNEMLGKLKGFKTFLETVEKEKLETLVNQNPTYFYDILPYTYVLGVSDKWIKKLESISIQAPSWYDSTNNFDISSFNSFMNSTMDSAKNVMSTRPVGSGDSSGSSSSSSGGGSAGGGSGGGGGGSW